MKIIKLTKDEILFRKIVLQMKRIGNESVKLEETMGITYSFLGDMFMDLFETLCRLTEQDLTDLPQRDMLLDSFTAYEEDDISFKELHEIFFRKGAN